MDASHHQHLSDRNQEENQEKRRDCLVASYDQGELSCCPDPHRDQRMQDCLGRPASKMKGFRFHSFQTLLCTASLGLANRRVASLLSALTGRNLQLLLPKLVLVP